MTKQISSLFAAATLASLALAAPRPALAEDGKQSRVHLGVFLGGHIFNDDNEIGAADVPDADSPGNTIIGGVRLGYGLEQMKQMFTIEGELAVMPTNSRIGDAANLTAFGMRVQGLAHLLPVGSKLRPFGLVGTSLMIMSSSDDRVLADDIDWVGLHFGGGAKYRLDDRTGLRADARLFLPPSSANESVTHDWEVTVGFYKTFDLSPKAPAPAPPPADTDGDGIVGDADKCPDKAEDKDGFEDEDGCPDDDNDGDGIPDATDNCREVAETMNGIDDTDGCPESDEDNDGIIGSADKCPADPEDKDGHEDTDGCPDRDNDGDGVTDDIDQCPAEKETANGYQDADGCPDEIPEEVAKFTGAIKGIRFTTGTAKLLASSSRVLDQAVKVLNDFPNLRLEIQGHTDSRGSDELNLKLSQARADAVKAYFVGKGIAEDRLQAVGYGETVPVGDNNTKQGQFENRRVEFKLIQ